MKFHIDRGSRLPYATQVERQATAQMIVGRLLPGERLPSVRQLARELSVSRTTAERIHEALCDSMLAEVRPRRGVFAASPDSTDGTIGLSWAHDVYQLLGEVARRGQELGLPPGRLAVLLSTLDETGASGTAGTSVALPILATRDAFECMVACLPPDFPARLVHLPPSTRPQPAIHRARYLLCGYYLRDRARLIAEASGSSVLHVRYNVTLLEEFMTIPASTHRHLVTRDADNAETTRVMLASAFPEIPGPLYTVTDLGTLLAGSGSLDADDVWVTATAAEAVQQMIPDRQIRIMHPVLDEDFIEELRCLALFLRSEAARG